MEWRFTKDSGDTIKCNQCAKTCNAILLMTSVVVIMTQTQLTRARPTQKVQNYKYIQFVFVFISILFDTQTNNIDIKIPTMERKNNGVHDMYTIPQCNVKLLRVCYIGNTE